MATETHRTTRLTEAQRNALFDKLDQIDQQSKGRNRRGAQRLNFRKSDVPVRIIQPGGSMLDCHVFTRELSASGMSFLYWGFLHSGTQVRITMPKRMGGHEVIEGVVRFCRHVVGVNHLVGVHFSEAITPKLFVEPAELGQDNGESKVVPAELSGKILLVDDSEIEQMLFKHQLSTTALEVHTATTASEALGKLAKEQFQIVFCDLNLAEISGEDALKQFRSAGYLGPMLVLTAENSPARIASAKSAGAAAIITKPYQPGKLIALIAHWLSDEAEGSASPIYSEMSKDPSMAPMVERYVGQVSSLAKQLRIHSDGQQTELVRKILQTLKGTGTGFGFPLLTDTALSTLKALEKGRCIDDARAELELLDNVCSRLRSTPANSSAA